MTPRAGGKRGNLAAWMCVRMYLFVAYVAPRRRGREGGYGPIRSWEIAPAGAATGDSDARTGRQTARRRLNGGRCTPLWLPYHLSSPRFPPTHSPIVTQPSDRRSEHAICETPKKNSLEQQLRQTGDAGQCFLLNQRQPSARRNQGETLSSDTHRGGRFFVCVARRSPGIVPTTRLIE